MKRAILFTFVSILTTQTLAADRAQEQDPRPKGEIFLGRRAGTNDAIDLVCTEDKCGSLKDKPLFPEQIQKLVKDKVIKDSSELNPSVNQILWSGSAETYPYADLWKDLYYPAGTSSGQNELNFQNTGETFEFLELKPDGFNQQTSIYVKQNGQDYNVRMGNLVHNNLLRKSLLRRIGYYIPPSQYMHRYNLKFTSSLAKEQQKALFDDMNKKTNAPWRWIKFADSDETIKCHIMPPDSPTGIKIEAGDDTKKVKVLEGNQTITITVKEQKEREIAKRQAAVDRCTHLLDNMPKTFEMQGAVAYKGLDDVAYNLSRGSLGTNGIPIIQNRRLLHALFVPYLVVDAVPQLNLFQMIPGNQFDDVLKLNHEEGPMYHLLREDARWILKRLARLTRADFYDIAREAEFQIQNGADRAAYERLIAERMISRLHFIADKLGMGKEFSHLRPDTKFDDNTGVIKDGLLTRDVCEGSLPMTCWEPNPRSPLDIKEYFAFGKSILLSNLFNEALKWVNEDYLPSKFEEASKKDQNGKALEYHLFVERPAEQFAKCIIAAKEGLPCKELGKDVWTNSYTGIQFIFARNVVFGAYLGADYPMQLVDTLGFVVDAGYFGYLDGLSAGKSVVGDIDGSFMMTYTHLKGTLSAEAAYNEQKKVKNIFVPRFKGRAGHILEDIAFEYKYASEADKKLVTEALAGRGDANALEESVLQKKINEIIRNFKDNFGVQESAIVTRTMGPKLGINFTKLLAHELPLGIGFNTQYQDITRLNYTRTDENTIQIFDSWAGKLDTQPTLNLFKYGLGFKGDVLQSNGRARTRFFRININPSIYENPGIIQSANALAKVLLTNNTDILHPYEKPDETELSKKKKELTKDFDEDFSPIADCRGVNKDGVENRKAYGYHVLRHKFHAPEGNASLLWGKFRKQKIMDNMSVTFPDCFQKELVLSTTGKRTGKDFQSFVQDAIDSYIQYETNWDFKLNIATNDNPGDTIFGSSRTRRVSFEAEKLRMDNQPKDSKLRLTKNPMTAVEYVWHGWDASGEKIKQIIREQEARFGGFQFYPDQDLQNIKKSELYTLYITIKFYEEAILHMANIPAESSDPNVLTVRKIFKTMANRDLDYIYREIGARNTIKHNLLDTIVKNFVRAQKDYRENVDKDPKKASVAALHMAGRIEVFLTREGMDAMIGGHKNMFIEPYLDGFKRGDPTGLKTVYGQAEGLIKSEDLKKDGPVRELMKTLNINTGEFYIYWLLNRL